MDQAHLFRLVVASPGDVQDERDVLASVVEELNHGMARDRGLRIELSRWEIDAYPGFHPQGPQGLIDEVLHIEGCDVLLGIFWKRFGTPTHDAQSGTEHEFQRAYAAWQQQRRPQIMIYFNQTPATPQTVEDLEQWRRVLEFRQQLPQEGLAWPYQGVSEFERLVCQHLTRVIRPWQCSMPSRAWCGPDDVLTWRHRVCIMTACDAEPLLLYGKRLGLRMTTGGSFGSRGFIYRHAIGSICVLPDDDSASMSLSATVTATKIGCANGSCPG